MSGLTYPEVGATRGPLPSGYDHADAVRVVGRGAAQFAEDAASLLRWDLQRRAGLTVRATAPVVAEGVDVVLTLGIGRVGFPAPCRVVHVVDEPRRQGFAYGTRAGHPESGEELFLLEHHDDDTVTLTVRAFSRPATWWSRLGHPVARLVQRRVTERYLRALVR